VFSGFNVLTRQRVAIKLLKEVDMDKIKREVKILQALKGLKGTNQFVEVCQEKGTGKILLVTGFVEGVVLNSIHTLLQERQIQKYVYMMLATIDRANSLGLMHRDIKPSNMIVNKKSELLTVLDWGLGEFYIPDKTYNLKVGTRPYRAPEILLGKRNYDFKVDTWSVGCILAGMVLTASTSCSRKTTCFPRLMKSKH